MARADEREAFGPNIWLVDEMYRRYQQNPQAVGESWREFFEGYKPHQTSPAPEPRDEGGDGGPKTSPERVHREAPAAR
jgi:multifunctional 2-oxoglutarate metabolism enzyme